MNGRNAAVYFAFFAGVAMTFALFGGIWIGFVLS